jgi:hypothetical protein
MCVRAREKRERMRARKGEVRPTSSTVLMLSLLRDAFVVSKSRGVRVESAMVALLTPLIV